MGCLILDIARYREHYPDLDAAFGDNWDLYVRHYFQYGIAEGRSDGTLVRQVSVSQVADENRDNVYVREDGISYDDRGNILIPWDIITEKKYLTLEKLRNTCITVPP